MQVMIHITSPPSTTCKRRVLPPVTDLSIFRVRAVAADQADPGARAGLRDLRVSGGAVRGLPHVGHQAGVRDQGLRLDHPGTRRRDGPHGLPARHDPLHLRLLRRLHRVGHILKKALFLRQESPGLKLSSHASASPLIPHAIPLLIGSSVIGVRT